MQRLILILPFLILFSCSVQKRKYQKGFYVSNTKYTKHVQKNERIKKEETTESIVLKQTKLPVKEQEDIILSASSDTKPFILLSQPLFNKIKSADSLCDVITLKNGEEVSAKILEITPTEVKYQKCGITDGPLYIVKKTDVFMIKYVNGSKEVFKTDNSEPTTTAKEPNSTSKDKYNVPQKVHPLAIWAFVLGILGFFTYGIGSILAIILGNIAIKKTRENPKMYSGDVMAKVGKILGIVWLSILAFALFIIILVAFLAI